MAWSSGPVCEEQLLCSICLDVFKEPVSTPCGHNFCQSCIGDYWERSAQTRCPLCKKRFRQKPVLRVNTGFRDMLEQLRSLSMSSSSEEQAQPGDVPCDICLPPKLRALNTCVVCLASYCSLHLEPHHRVPSLKQHRLIEPKSSLEHSVCQKHHMMLKLYCSTDQSCVCSLCLQDDHASHRCVPLEDAFAEGRDSANQDIEQLDLMEGTKLGRIKRVGAHMEQRKKKKESDVAEIDEAFVSLMDSLQRHRAALVKEVEQKHDQALKPYQDRVQELQKSVADIQRRRAKLQERVQIDDHLLFLLNKPEPFYSPQNDQPIRLDPEDGALHISALKPALKIVENVLSEEMKRVIRQVQSPDGTAAAAVRETWIPPRDRLTMIQQNDAVDLSLDPRSAHRALTIEGGGKLLFYNPLALAEPPPPSWFQTRFQNLPFALSVDGFSSGRFYFEVDVSAAKDWVLGVVSDSINRQFTAERFPEPSDGAWLMSSTNLCRDLICFVSPSAMSKVGVFVDHEKGEVSFYDVRARVLAASYRGCSFTQPVPLLKSFLYGLGGASVSSRTKLHPVFGVSLLFGNLKITPVIV